MTDIRTDGHTLLKFNIDDRVPQTINMVSHPPPLLEVHNVNGDELSEDDDDAGCPAHTSELEMYW